MTVEIYSGGWPDFEYERQAIISLARMLHARQEWYVLLVRFQIPGGDRPDLVVLKEDCIIPVDFKHNRGLAITGSVNGPWNYIDANANSIGKLVNAKGKNPYEQLSTYWRHLANYLIKEVSRVWPDRTATLSTDINRNYIIRPTVALYPTLLKDSRIDLDWKVKCVGCDRLAEHIFTQKGRDFHLSQQEAVVLAKHSGLQLWRDITSFVEASPGLPNVDWKKYAGNVRNANTLETYIPQYVKYDSRTVLLVDLLKSNNLVAVLGPAGSGKSTNLTQLTLSLLDSLPTKIPIKIRLDLYDKDHCIRHLVISTLKENGIVLDDDRIDRLFRNGNLILLMDGWSEINPMSKVETNKDIERWMTDFPQHKILLASRSTTDISTGNDVPTIHGLKVFTLELFSDTDVEKYFNVKTGSSVSLTDLSPRLRDIARYPLFAKLLSEQITDKSMAGTDNITALIDAFIRRDIIKSTGVIPQSIENVLEELLADFASFLHLGLKISCARREALACIHDSWQRLHEEKRTSVAEDAVINSIVSMPFIIQEYDRVGFSHQLFQEYYAGVWLANYLKSDPAKCRRLLVDPWWYYPTFFASVLSPDIKEIFDLLVAAGRTDIIGKILSGEGSEAARKLYRNMIDDMLDSQGENKLVAAKSISASAGDIWSFERLIRTLDEDVKDNKFQTNTAINFWEYMFLTPLREALTSLARTSPNMNLSKLPLDSVLKVKYQSFCSKFMILTAIHAIVSYRFSENIKSEDILDRTIEFLIGCSKDKPYNTKLQAIEALGTIAMVKWNVLGEKVPPLIVQTLKEIWDGNQWIIGEVAGEQLAAIGEGLSAGDTEDAIVKFVSEAENAIQNNDSEAACGLVDPSLFASPVVGEIFGQLPDKLGKEKYEKLLLLALENADFTKGWIMQLLSEYGSDTSILSLVNEITIYKEHSNDDYYHNNHFQNKMMASFALACIDTPSSFHALQVLLDDDNWQAKFVAAVALSYLSIRGNGGIEKTLLSNKFIECWQIAGINLLKFLRSAYHAILPINPELGSQSRELPSSFILDTVVPVLPSNEVRLAANILLIEGNDVEADFSCQLLGSIGTKDDLVNLHTKMHNPYCRESAGKAIRQIQSRQ